jgi:proton-translocating NADH-quinone oxidoreductase chain N
VPLFFIGIPLLAVMLLNLGPRKWVSKQAAYYTALTVTVLQMALAVYVCVLVGSGSVSSVRFAEKLSVDLLSGVTLFTIGLVALVSLLVSRASLAYSKFSYFSLLLLIMTGMNGLTMVTDLFSAYVFVEAVSAASFVMIAINKHSYELEGAFKYYMLSAIATILMLSGIGLFFLVAGGTDFKTVASFVAQQGDGVIVIAAFSLFTAGLLIKSGVVPFHTWVPDAYSAASAPVSVLLGGIVTKVSGVYVLMRVYRDVFLNQHAVGNVLLALGFASVIIGALAAIGQDDFKRMLAYSSISQIGYIVLGVATGSPLGFAGAMLHFFNHATFKGLLFVDAAAIETQTGARSMAEMRGLAKRMPVTGVSSIIAFLSTAGIPPLSGFFSKLLIVMALWRVSAVLGLVALAASILTLAYFLMMQKKVFFGKPSENTELVREAGRETVLAEVLLSAVNIAGGLLFPLVLAYLHSIGQL